MTERPIRGLEPAQVKEARELYGTNTISRPNTHGFLAALGSNFSDPIIRILLAALAINLILTFNGAGWLEPVGIAVALLLSTLVSTLSEFSSETAFNRMREEASAVTCRVIRSGRIQRVPAADIVVGDSVIISAGEKIPADGVVMQGEIRVDQSPLNGESKETVKRPGRSAETGLNAKDKLFCGALAVSGEAVMTVTRVGDGTIYGKTALEMAGETLESPMRGRLRHLAGTLSKLGLAAAILVAATDIFKTFFMDNGFDPHRIAQSFADIGTLTSGLIHALILAVTVVVVAVPEGLPMMITVVLSSNMVRMLKDGVLVRKPVGIETAGSMNILFTDKTGTLTAGRLSLVYTIDGGGNEREADKLSEYPALREMFTMSSVYNSSCTVSEGKISGGDSTDRALLAAALPMSGPSRKRKVVSRVPFSSARKYSAATLDNGMTFVKGAPEIILPACISSMLADGHTVPLSMSRIKTKMNAAAARSLRVVAIAVTGGKVEEGKQLSGLTLVCLACIRDNLRTTTRRAVKTIHDAGIQVVMLTGDNLVTACAIAEEAGITAGGKGAYDASAIRSMSDEKLKEILPDIRVIARSLPSDKSRLVALAQEKGMVVGMTGDGVNDAPALKRADVGFAMGSGSDVAKEAGDVVILNDDLASIGKAVLYGRTIFKSIRKFIVFQLTMNMCAVGISVLGPLLGVEMPITVIQMLWVNMIMDTLAGLAFAGEPPLPEYMKEPPKPRDARVLTQKMLAQIGRMGTFTLLLCALFLKLPVFEGMFSSAEGAFMSAFFTLFIFCGLFNAFNARTPGVVLTANLKKNKMFVAIMAAAACIQLFLVRFGGQMFRTVPLTFNEIIWVFILSFAVIPADILCKMIGKAREKRSAAKRVKNAEKDGD